nr:MAG TPA: hypothetical protein [Caudoviricetes sp.]
MTVLVIDYITLIIFTKSDKWISNYTTFVALPWYILI